MAIPAFLLMLMTMMVLWAMHNIYRVFSPAKMMQMMESQGIRGPNPNILLGNLLGMRKIIQNANAPNSRNSSPSTVLHKLEPVLFPHFVEWKKAYGKKFVYWLGREAMLYVQEPELIQEMASTASLMWGRPAFLKNDRYPLFGNGLIMAEDQSWLHQRRIVLQALSAEKIKGMLVTVIEATMTVLNEWGGKILHQGGQSGSVEIEVDADLNNITTHVISKLLFGSSYNKGFHILDKLKSLQQAIFKAVRFVGVPGSRFIHLATHRRTWKLGEEINNLIIEIINERMESKSSCRMEDDDLLGVLLKEDVLLSRDDVVDECKTLLLAGQETTKLSLTWTLMLLALHPHWQHKLRSEIMEITQGAYPDINMLSKMKLMTMVMNEAMRLYPPVSYTVRQAKQDIRVGKLEIPKGMSVFINIVGMHHDPDIWGHDDVFHFNPERFRNAKRLSGFMPFGFGGRVCVGEKMARMEHKTVLTMILSRFSFSLSPNYIHSPSFALSIMPSHGMQLLFTKL